MTTANTLLVKCLDKIGSFLYVNGLQFIGERLQVFSIAICIHDWEYGEIEGLKTHGCRKCRLGILEDKS